MTIYRLDVPQYDSGEFGGRLAALAFRMVDRLKRLRDAIRNRRSVKRLVEWDDHMLHDIGLTRRDLVSAMSGTIGDDPARRLSALASERRRAEHAAAERLSTYGSHPKSWHRRTAEIVEIRRGRK